MARPSEVGWVIWTTVLPGDDVLCVEWKWFGKSLRKPAVFAPATGTLPHELALRRTQEMESG